MYTTIKRIFKLFQFSANEPQVLYPEDFLLRLGGVSKLLNISREDRGVIEEDLIEYLDSNTRGVYATAHTLTIGEGVLGTFWEDFLKFMETKYNESSKVTS